MKQQIKIEAKKRETTSKNVSQIRLDGSVPGVVYGLKTKPISLFFDRKQTDLVLHFAEKASIFPLVIEGEEKERNVLIKELQFDKLTERLVHFDFYEVDMKKEIETEVPLRFIGLAMAVKDLGGVLVKNIDEVSIKCLPTHLPEEIVVDISILKNFEDIILIKDLKISEGVEILNGGEEVVAKVSAPRSEKEMEELNEEVEGDVSKVEGVADKALEPAEGETGDKEKK
jgi:large subunit ribosomal protein L25